MESKWKPDTPLTWRENLGMALLIAILLIGWLVWSRAAGSELFAAERSAPSAYVRREKKPPLSPALFVGQTAAAYRVANDIPDILDQLYCYCECDKHLGHKSLLSCFTDDHGAG
jgi:hypothetical protein